MALFNESKRRCQGFYDANCRRPNCRFLRAELNANAISGGHAQIHQQKPLPGMNMAIVRTSPRVFGLAATFLMVFNGLVAAVAIASLPTEQIPTPDRAFQNFLAHNAVFIGLLVSGHFALRQRQIGTRSAYAVMGGAAAALAYAFALKQGLLIKPPIEGTRLTAGILPAIIGTIAGTLYVHFAGYEASEALTAPPVGTVPQASASAPASMVPSDFNGPVQVRTSFAATALAAIAPAVSIAVVMMLYFGMVSVWEYAATPTRKSWSVESTGILFSGYLFFVALFVTIIPGAIAIQIVHGIARSLKRTDYLAYMALGAGIGTFGALILMTTTPIALFGGLMIVCGAIMGAVYRRLAGIEPLALPEIILATDRRTLVGADDPARRTRAVVFNG